MRPDEPGREGGDRRHHDDREERFACRLRSLRAGTLRPFALVPPIYVTGHRNPDADSIAAAIGYAELKRRLDSGNEYKPVRLGELNAQTSWLIERAGAPVPTCCPTSSCGCAT